jgi:hypothetical protein
VRIEVKLAYFHGLFVNVRISRPVNYGCSQSLILLAVILSAIGPQDRAERQTPSRCSSEEWHASERAVSKGPERINVKVTYFHGLFVA